MCRQGEIIDISKYYRIASLAISSILYAICIPTYTIVLKIVVLSGMLLSSVILIALYQSIIREKAGLWLVAIEVIWNSFFLEFSGGFFSPYLWYCISSVILSYVAGRLVGVCMTLTIYMGTGIWVAWNRENMPQSISYTTSIIACGFLLLAIIVLLLVHYGEQLIEQRKRMEILLSINQSRPVMTELCRHTNEILKAEAAVWIVLDGADNIQYIQRYNWPETLEPEIVRMIREKEWNTVHKIESRVERLQSFWCCVSFLPYNTSRNGIYMYLGKKERTILRKRQILNEYLLLLQNLLHKEYTEELYEELLLREEQNRIANEIHDTVLQKLFAISCHSYILEEKFQGEEEKQAMRTLKQSLDETMGELRAAVYGYSWNGNGEEPFIARIEKYLARMRQLYGIQIDFTCEPDMQLVRKNQKTALYRIISEAISNAIHHGNAHNIQICLKHKQHQLYTSIMDDGTGMNMQEAEKKAKGIGINNITYLTELCGGRLTIVSKQNEGMSIEVVLPLLG